MKTGPDLPSHGWRWCWMVLLVFALSLGLRALFLADVRHDPTYHHLVHDEGVNDQIARAILAGEMPAVSYYKAPLYMYALAGLYRILGEDPMRARWPQIVLDSLSPVLVLLIARALFGSLAGVIAGLVAAVFWTFVFYAPELVDTSLACLFYLLLAYLIVALPDGKAVKWPICGVVLGLGAITRPNVLAFAPVLAITVVVAGWLRERQTARSASDPAAARGPLRLLRRPLLHAIGLTLGCLVPILPLTVRNYVVADERTLIATYGGLNFYVANSPWSDGKHGPLIVGEGVPDISAIDPNNLWSRLDLNYNVAKTYAQTHLGRTLSMQEVDAFFYDLTQDYIRDRPGKFLSDCVKRFCWFFNSYEFPNVKDLYRLCGVSQVLAGLSHFHYGMLCPIAVLGVVLTLLRRGKTVSMVYYLAMLGALFLPGLFFVMSSRYRLPTVYLLVPFAAFGVVEFVRLWRTPGRWRLRLVSCGILAGTALLCNVDLFGYSDTHHTELRMTYAQACERTERLDLLPDAADRFERAYFDELNRRSGRPWASTLHHCAPMTWMFIFHFRTDNTSQALRYGAMMVEQEPFNPPAFLRYYEILLANERPEQARKLLDVFEQLLMPHEPEIAIETFMRFWTRFNDRAVLRRAEALLVPLSNANPDKTYFHFTLYKVRELLEMTRSGTQPSTAPATRSTSQETRRP